MEAHLGENLSLLTLVAEAGVGPCGQAVLVGIGSAFAQILELDLLVEEGREDLAERGIEPAAFRLRVGQRGD